MIYLRYLWKEISYKGESIWNLALIGYFLDSNLSFHFVERIGSFGKADVHCPALEGREVWFHAMEDF